MDTQKFGPPLALSLAIASVLSPGLAGAQSSLQVYSDDFGGPNQSAPGGATRDTVISMSVPRLHAVIARLRVVEGILGSHPIPPHRHPHTHPVVIIPIIVDGVPEQGSVDASGQVTVASLPGWSYAADSGDFTALSVTVNSDGTVTVTDVPTTPPGLPGYGPGAVADGHTGGVVGTATDSGVAGHTYGL